MKAFFLIAMTLLCSLTFLTETAYAKRFGGGRSFGVQKSQYHYNSYNQSKKANSSQPSKTKKWGGFLGGLLAGGLLTSLLMGHGFGSGMLSWLLIGSLIALVIFFIQKKNSLKTAHAGNTHNFSAEPDIRSNQEYAPNQFNNQVINGDNTELLRQAKALFIRLQVAYDQANLADIASFSSPEVYAEIKLQLDERGPGTNVTDIINLDSQILDISDSVDGETISVEFTGTLKETLNGLDDVINLHEIWHLRRKPIDNQLVLCGIQQIKPL